MDSDDHVDEESNNTVNVFDSSSDSIHKNDNSLELKSLLLNLSSYCDENSENDRLQYKSEFAEILKNVSYTYQYLDHPADVILLGEGNSLKKALESVSVSMFNYMCDLSYVDPIYYKKMAVLGRGLLNFLYHLLDECLYLYSSEYFIAKHVFIMEDFVLPPICSGEEFNNYEFETDVIAIGDYYNKDVHRCGTEIKAITMHYLSFNILINDKWYEYKNDMESQGQVEDLLNTLKIFDNKIDRCKVFALVDI